MIKQFLLNIMLTLIWVMLTGELVVVNFAFGFILSYMILWIVGEEDDSKRYFTRVPAIISFIFFFIYEMLKANLHVAYDVITPRFFMKPGIVKYPLDARTNLEITFFTNLISLTPGTLILDVSDDKKVVYIHVMYLEDKDAFIQQIKGGLEKRLLDILR
ncbi:multicomponent Na+:H+ antiporter subunit E [Chitinophaga terrae (ex Kim and Jung 2007)]|uniref:Na+/H+ antiporter subunit E n=1 Tax=Chitinophaga terrae (ex Kim and Jung 2007) TaxID=408074 RepID=UPI002786A20B|nr:Na+/H+ antiporter subunit E [Chitinophaga terrae (ex Kim and Jung 2007)]MDQ0110158.1 multicomponent Na+:H+ antiporter subunit E [Chitinophaga terrae (ex Kim and Jung 2007)]